MRRAEDNKERFFQAEGLPNADTPKQEQTRLSEEQKGFIENCFHTFFEHYLQSVYLTLQPIPHFYTYKTKFNKTLRLLYTSFSYTFYAAFFWLQTSALIS